MCKREDAYLSSRESLISIVTAHTRITVLLPLFIHTGSKKGTGGGRSSNLTLPATLLILIKIIKDYLSTFIDGRW